MAYQANKNYSNSKPAYNAGGNTQKKSEAIFEKLMKPSKSGKSVATFAVGEKDIVLPAGTRVVITALTEKQLAGLDKARKDRGFQGPVPTHKLSVFPIDEARS